MRGAFNHWITTMGLLGGFALLLSGCGQTQPTTPINPNQLDSRGGTIRSNDEKASLQIPGQTLSGAVVFSLAPSNQTVKAPADKVLVSGTMYALGSTPSTTLAKPSTLSIQYDPALVEGLGRKLGVSSQAAANTLEIARLANGAWVPVGGSSADPNASTVQAPITEMGIYALLAPDGSKPVWRLEVRGGIGAIGNNINEVQPIAEAINRNYLYISLSRNGQVPTSPVALHVSGPNGYNTTLPYAEGRNWGIFGLATRQAGLFTLRFSADGQDVSSTVDIAATPTLPLPVVSAQVVSGRVETRWEPIATAQSYEVRLYGPTLSVVQTLQTKNTNANLTIPSNLIGQNIAVMVLAYTWDNTLERTQPYPTVLEKTNASASLVSFTQSNPPSNPSNTPRLINLSPVSLSLTTGTGRTASAFISFGNGGTAPLTYRASVNNSSFRILGNEIGTVDPGLFPRLQVEGTCGSTQNTLTGIFTLTTNDPNTPTRTVPLRLECFGFTALRAELVYNEFGHKGGSSSYYDPTLSDAEWSPDRSRIATYGSGEQVIIWDAQTGRSLLRSQQAINAYSGTKELAMRWSPTGGDIAFISYSGDRIRILDSSTGRERLVIRALNGDFDQLAWSPNGTQIASRARNELHIYETTAGNLRHRISLPTEFYNGGSRILGWSTDGSQVLTLDGINSNGSPVGINFWRVSDGSLARQQNIQIPSYWGMAGEALSPNRATLAIGLTSTSGSDEYRVQLYRISDGQALPEFPTNRANRGSLRLQWSQDGSRILASSRQCPALNPNSGICLHLWRTSDGALLHSIATSIDAAQQGITLSASGDQALISSTSTVARLISLVTGNPVLLLGNHGSSIRSLDFDSSNRLLSGSNNINFSGYNLSFRNLSSSQITRFGDITASGMQTVTWMPNNRVAGIEVDSQSGFAALKVFDTTTQQQTRSVSIEGRWFVWSPDGRRLLYQPSEQRIGIFDVENTRHLADLETQPNDSPIDRTSIAWSPDGSQIVRPSSGELVFFEPQNGRIVRRITASGGFLPCFMGRIFWQGNSLVCGSSSGQLGVMNVTNGQMIFTQNEPNSSERLVGLSPNGQQLVLVSDTTTRIISLNGIELLRMPNGDYNSISDAAWSSDGSLLAFGGVTSLEVYRITPQP